MTALIADLTAKIEAALAAAKVARDVAWRESCAPALGFEDRATMALLACRNLTECEADLRDALGRVL